MQTGELSCISKCVSFKVVCLTRLNLLRQCFFFPMELHKTKRVFLFLGKVIHIFFKCSVANLLEFHMCS